MDDVADKDPDGGFITAHMKGFGEPSFGPFSVRNWNTSRDDGPLGPPCVLPRPILASFQRLNIFEKLKNRQILETLSLFFQQFPSFCYKTCNTCRSLISYNTCDHSSCYDDVHFARTVIDYVAENYCLDRNREGGQTGFGIWIRKIENKQVTLITLGKWANWSSQIEVNKIWCQSSIVTLKKH